MADRPSESRLRKLTTKAEVMKALGGVHVIAVICKTDWKNVETWNRALKFPARYFLVMMFALVKEGFTAPPELWGMLAPAARRKALLAIVAQQRGAPEKLAS